MMKLHAKRRSVIPVSFYSLLFTLIFFGAPLVLKATPLSEYTRNLQRAITALDSLSQMDEEESQANYEHRLNQTTTAVRNALPEKQSVESGSRAWTVDNSWLHKKLDEFEAAKAAERDDLRNQLIQTLKTIHERTGELEKAPAVDDLSKEEANRRLQNILSRSEYGGQSSQQSALFRLLDRFIRWLSQFLPRISPMNPSRGSPLTLLAQFVVVALAVAVIVYVSIKLVRHFGKRPRNVNAKKENEPRIVLGERLEPEASATDLLTEAEALARNGEIRAAIRKTYIALLVELGDRKIISLAQHKTNRDYLRAVSDNPSLYGNMRGLTDSFERHWYGFAETSPNDWQAFKAAYLAALGTNG